MMNPRGEHFSKGCAGGYVQEGQAPLQKDAARDREEIGEGRGSQAEGGRRFEESGRRFEEAAEIVI